MALPSFCRDSITVVRPKPKSERGVTVPNWDSTTSRTITGCSVQPRSTSTSYDSREAVTVRAVAYLPPNSDIQAGDRVEWGGHAFAIDGEPLPINSPTGKLLHIKAQLIDWEG